MKMIEIHTAEGDMFHLRECPRDVEAGEFVMIDDRTGVIARDQAAGDELAAVKRGTVSLLGRGYPAIIEGYTGPLYASVTQTMGDIRFLALSIFSGTPIGVVEGWDYSDRVSPRFLVSLGDQLAGAAVDSYVRTLAQNAYNVALGAYNVALGAVDFPLDNASFNGSLNLPANATTAMPLVCGNTTFIDGDAGRPTGKNKAGDDTIILLDPGLYIMSWDISSYTADPMTKLEVEIFQDGGRSLYEGRVSLGHAALQGSIILRYFPAPLSGESEKRMQMRIRNKTADILIADVFLNFVKIA